MNADDLSRVVMSSTLATALSRARENARAQGHSEVTLEHMLMALCEDPDAGLVLAASNVDVMKLKSDASRYLVSLERQAFAGRATDPGVSADLRRILDAAAAAARGEGAARSTAQSCWRPSSATARARPRTCCSRKD